MFKKTVLITFLFLFLFSSLAWSDSLLQGPFDLEVGLKQYKTQTDWKVYHLGKDNELYNFEGQCTWFCYAVTREKMPTGNAWTWYSSFAKKNPERVGSIPQIEAICVWKGDYCIDASTGEKYGHVAKVTKIYEDGSFEIWESNYQKLKITRRLITDRSQILGFIYPLEENIKPLEVVDKNKYPSEAILKKQNLISTGPNINYRNYKFMKTIDPNTGVNSIAVSNNIITFIVGSRHMCRLIQLDINGKQISSQYQIGQYYLKKCHQISGFKNNIIVMADATYQKEKIPEERYIFLLANSNNTNLQKIGEGRGENPKQYYTWNYPEIKFDTQGNTYITDNTQGFGRIQKFSPQGVFVKQITNREIPRLIYPKILFCLNKKIYVKIEKGDSCHGTRILIFDADLNLIGDKIFDLTANLRNRSIWGSDIGNACTDYMGNIYFIFHNGLMMKYDRNFKLIFLKEINSGATQIVVDEFGKIFILYGGHYSGRIQIWEPIK